MALLGAARPDLGEGGHGIATDFFGGIGEEGQEPLADRLFEVRLEGIGKSSADGADEGDLAHLFLSGGCLKKGYVLLPKTEPREGAEFSVPIFGGASVRIGHGGASVCQGGNSSPASERTSAQNNSDR